MGAELLERFLKEDCDAALRTRLLASIRARSGTATVERFTTNVFNVLVDYENGRVVIEDELDGSQAGRCVVGLDEFVRRVDAG